MSAQPETQKKVDQSRRDFLRKVGVGSATAAGVSTGAIRLDHGPVQNSQAIAPAVAAAGVGGSMAVGWALREYEVIGSDSPPEGLTADALQNSIYNISQTRLSTNSSTIVDNANIVESGLSNTAYADGKIAGIDALNDQLTESEVLSNSRDASHEYLTTVLKNFFRTWNEAVNELYTQVAAIQEHPDLSVDDVYSITDDNGGVSTSDGDTYLKTEPGTTEYTLPDGSTMDVQQFRVSIRVTSGSGASTQDESVDPTNPDSENLNADSYGIKIRVSNQNDDNVEYLRSGDFGDILDTIETVKTDVDDGLSTWVNGVYSDVQAGELETEELLTPREQAELTADDEGFAQAISDLQALNISVDLEREAEIHLSGPEATLYGQLAYTGDTTLSTGTINPDATDDDDEPIYPGSIYFTYDVSQGQGTFSSHETGIDGGILTLTSEPFVESLYVVHTVAGETAEFTTGDLTENDDGDEWTIDLSDQLDDSITDVEKLEYFAESDSTQYETIQLTETFEIVDFTDSDGNSYDETDFERSEPQTDDNYITEEEWQEQQERHEELIEKYEDAQGGGGITIGGTSIPTELIGLGLAVLAAIGLLR